jgi:hypothetical protein
MLPARSMYSCVIDSVASCTNNEDSWWICGRATAPTVVRGESGTRMEGESGLEHIDKFDHVQFVKVSPVGEGSAGSSPEDNISLHLVCERLDIPETVPSIDNTCQ